MVMMRAYSQNQKVLKSQIFSCQNRQKSEFHAEGQKGAGPRRPPNFEDGPPKFKYFLIKNQFFGAHFFVWAEKSRSEDVDSLQNTTVKYALITSTFLLFLGTLT